MNSELLKVISERLKELQKRKTELTEEKKSLDKVAEYMGLKGKKKLKDITNELAEVDGELVDLDNDFVEYQRLSQEVEEIQKLVKQEKKALTKAALERLLAEKTAIFEELETELKNEFLTETTEETKSAENQTQKEETEKVEAELVDEDEETEENSNVQEGEIIDVDYEEVDKEEEDSKEKSKEEKPKNKKQKNKKTIRNVVIGGVCLLALVVALKSCGNDNDKTNTNDLGSQKPTTETMDTQTPTPSETPEIEFEDDKGTDEIEEVYDVNVFDDITDIDKLNARTSEIMSDITPMLDSMGKSYDEEELKSNIRNTILVSNGELPIDNDGKQYYEPSVLDYYTQFRTDTFGNIPSSPQHEDEELFKVNYAAFALEGSEVETFVSRYDKVYNDIAEARNNENYETFEKNAIELGKLLYEDWVLQGMNTGQNPYNFETKQRLFALGASIERYASYVMEYENGQRKTVCVPVCTDYETGEIREIPLEDIFIAIVLGESNDATLAAGAGDGYQVISEDFYAQTNEIMAYNYENGNILTLK